MTERIHLQSCLPDGEVEALKGTFVGDDFYDLLLTPDRGSVDGCKPNGETLFAYRPRALRPDVCRRALPALRLAAQPTNNRGTAAGGGWQYRRKADGTPSNRRSAREVLSGLMGFMDRHGQDRYCRPTRFTAQQVAHWVATQPYLRAVDAVFREACPERYAAQMAAVRATHPEWVIEDTAFTTVTVNRDFQTAVHTDKGDLPEGFGVITVLRRGEYRGGYLVFPKYRVAVDLGDRDVLLADVHEYHGNTAITHRSAEAERISCVLYFRRHMIRCGSRRAEERKARGW